MPFVLRTIIVAALFFLAHLVAADCPQMYWTWFDQNDFTSGHIDPRSGNMETHIHVTCGEPVAGKQYSLDDVTNLEECIGYSQAKMVPKIPDPSTRQLPPTYTGGSGCEQCHPPNIPYGQATANASDSEWLLCNCLNGSNMQWLPQKIALRDFLTWEGDATTGHARCRGASQPVISQFTQRRMVKRESFTVVDPEDPVHDIAV